MLEGTNDNTPERAAQIRAYARAMEEYSARQARAKQAKLAFDKKHRTLGLPRWPTQKQTWNRAYYEGGLRLVIDGYPIRVAAHVARWKKSNREALGQGYDPYGLTLRPHGKHGGFLDHDRTGYWWRHWKRRYITETAATGELIFLNDRGPDLMENRRRHEYTLERQRDRASLGPNLFQWARIARKLAQSKERKT